MKRYKALLIIAAIAAASCTVKTDPEVPGSVVVLNMEPTLKQAPETKQAVFGNPSGDVYLMPNDATFGLFICQHHDGSYTDGSNVYDEYSFNYKNIKAVRTSNVWYYTYFGYENLKELYLRGVDDDYDGVTDFNADIFAYAPYVENMDTPEAIPFSISGADDVMYASQNSDSAVNKDIDPATAGTGTAPNPRVLDVPLTFCHALSLLEFNITLKNSHTNHSIAIDPYTGEQITMPVNYSKGYTIDYIKIERSAIAQHPLYVSGTMNAMTEGTLSNLVAAESVTVSGASLGRHRTTSTLAVSANSAVTPKAYVLQVPSQDGEEYNDGDYVISFKFGGQNFPVRFLLLKDHIKHSDGTYGFKSGFKYTFNLVIDNYIHFEGLNVGLWTDADAPIQKEI